MEYREYWSRLARALDLDVSSEPPASTDLYDELGLDSLQAFELIVFTEELAGLKVVNEELTALHDSSATRPALFTIGDAYDFFVACTKRTAPQDGQR